MRTTSTGQDGERRAGVSMLRSVLSDLAVADAAADGAGASPAARARAATDPECRATRAAIRDYLKGRLMPRRRRRLEFHLDGCGECTREFIDVREVTWGLRGRTRALSVRDHRSSPPASRSARQNPWSGGSMRIKGMTEAADPMITSG